MPLQVGGLIKALEETDIEKPCAEGIKEAIKFVVPDIKPITDKALVDYSILLVNAGLLKLPFETCYFEFQNISGKYSNLKTLAVLAFVPPRTKDIVTRSFQREIDGEYDWYFDDFVSGWSEGASLPTGDGGWRSPELLKKLYPDATWDQGLADSSQVAAQLVAAAIAFMDLKESRLIDQTVAHSVSDRRASQGKSTLYSHRVLTLNPAVKRQFFSGVSGLSGLITRRAHWRRGHLRHLPGKIVPVAPALIRGEGFISKDYTIGL